MVKLLFFLDILTLEDGTDMLSRNVGKRLPLDAALYRRRAQISSASRRKREITERVYIDPCEDTAVTNYQVIYLA
jgi:hypothetical protein